MPATLLPYIEEEVAWKFGGVIDAAGTIDVDSLDRRGYWNVEPNAFTPWGRNALPNPEWLGISGSVGNGDFVFPDFWGGGFWPPTDAIAVPDSGGIGLNGCRFVAANARGYLSVNLDITDEMVGALLRTSCHVDARDVAMGGRSNVLTGDVTAVQLPPAGYPLGINEGLWIIQGTNITARIGCGTTSNVSGDVTLSRPVAQAGRPITNGGTFRQWESGTGAGDWIQRFDSVNALNEHSFFTRTGAPGRWQDWEYANPPTAKIPAGLLASGAGDNVPAAGWLLCNGQTVASATYPELFAVIGTTYGGDATNFALPDPRDYFLRGGGTPGAIETALTARPRSTATVTATESHSHTGSTNNVGDHEHLSPYNYDAGVTPLYGTANSGISHDKRFDGQGANINVRPRTSTQSSHSHTVNSATFHNHTHGWASGGDAETRPRNIRLPLFISTGQ